MTDQQTEPTTSSDSGGQDDAPTMADVRELVKEELSAALEPFKKLLGGGSSDAPAPASTDSGGGLVASIDGQIEAAISKVLGDRDKRTAEDEHARHHEALRAAEAERAPVARPRRSRWLGNIWDS